MPVKARAGLERYAEQWASRGVLAWEEVGGAPLRVGDRLAPLVGGPFRVDRHGAQRHHRRGGGGLLPRPAATQSPVVIADLDFPVEGTCGTRCPGPRCGRCAAGTDQPPHRDRAPGDRQPGGGGAAEPRPLPQRRPARRRRDHAPPTTPAPWWCSTATSRRGRSPSPSRARGGRRRRRVGEMALRRARGGWLYIRTRPAGLLVPVRRLAGRRGAVRLPARPAATGGGDVAFLWDAQRPGAGRRRGGIRGHRGSGDRADTTPLAVGPSGSSTWPTSWGYRSAPSAAGAAEGR